MSKRTEALVWCGIAAIGIAFLQTSLKQEAAIAGLSALELALLTAAATAWVTRTTR